jgi:hypothetical protein
MDFSVWNMAAAAAAATSSMDPSTIKQLDSTNWTFDTAAAEWQLGLIRRSSG